MPVRILVVDEDPHLPAQVRRACGSMSQPVAVDGAPTATAALDRLQADRYEIVLTDVRLPDGVGTDLLEHVRRRHPRLVRILVAGRADRDLVYRSVGEFHRCVPKPWRPVPLQRVMGFASEAVADLPDSTRIALTGMRSLPGLTSHPRSFASTRRPVCDSAFFAAAERDPALAAQILRLCCSHYFGARRTVPDVHAAVALLGPSAVEAVIAGLDAPGSEDALWAPARRTAAHATRTAVLARDIALDMGCAIPVADHAYSAALLHEVGQLVQSRDPGDRVTPLILAPRQTPSTSAREGAPVLAGRLLTLWGLPATIVSAIADHKRPSSAADPAASGVLAAVHVADAIQHALESGTAPAIDCDYLGRLGLTNKLGGWIDAASDASRTA